MIVVDIFETKNGHDIIVKKGYTVATNEYKKIVSTLFSLGFKLNKTRRHYFKSISKRYPINAVTDTLETLKSLDSHYVINSYKLIYKETNIKSHN